MPLRVHRHPLCSLLLLAPCLACAHDPAPPAVAPEPAPAVAPSHDRIENGDFSSGVAPWGAHVIGEAHSQHPLEPRLENGALCTTVRGGEEVVVGWPVAGSSASFELAAGQKYELALRISASGALPVKCLIKVGHQLAPYTAAFTTDLPVTPELAAFTTSFVPDHADDQAGIAIECRGEKGEAQANVCIDDVSLN